MNNFGYGGYGTYSFPSYTPNNFTAQNAQNLGYGQQNAQPQANVQQSNTFAYVNGLEGAKAYLVQPNTTVLLMDSDNPCFYQKSANQQGQANLRKFDFQEVDMNAKPTVADQPQVDLSNYVKRDEFDKLNNKLDELIKSNKNKGGNSNV